MSKLKVVKMKPSNPSTEDSLEYMKNQDFDIVLTIGARVNGEEILISLDGVDKIRGQLSCAEINWYLDQAKRVLSE